MSTLELKRLVDDATPEEQQFLFICLSEKLCALGPAELEELDRRWAEMEAGRNRLSLAEFEERFDASHGLK